MTSISLVEWFLNWSVYEDPCCGFRQPSPAVDPAVVILRYEQAAATGLAVEGVARAGDVVVVPRGWWHAAINLEWTVAITHNWCSAASLRHVLRSIKVRVSRRCAYYRSCCGSCYGLCCCSCGSSCCCW